MTVKTAYICFYEAYPPDSGAAVVSYCMAVYSTGNKLLVQVCDRDELSETPEGVKVCSVDGRVTGKLSKITGLKRRLSEVLKVVREYCPDTVVLEGASWVVYHYFLMRCLRKKLPGIRLIYHSHNVEYILRKQKNGVLISALTRWAESKVIKNVDNAFAVSDVDADQFDNLYGIRPDVLANGVDVQRYLSVSDESLSGTAKKYGITDQTLLFMGLYAYKPNTEAVDFLVNAVMPKVYSQFPNVKLIITGGTVPYDEPWLINPGMVPYEDVPGIVGSCKAGLAPVFSGSGTRLKILEYMAGGIPVLATDKGAEGLSVTDGQDIMLANDEKAFAEKIVTLLEDNAKSAAVSAKGRELVTQRYDWPIVLKSFNERLMK